MNCGYELIDTCFWLTAFNRIKAKDIRRARSMSDEKSQNQTDFSHSFEMTITSTLNL